MKRFLRFLVPFLLVLVIFASMAWYVISYDRSFALEVLLDQARYWEGRGNHTTAAWFYNTAYKYSGNSEEVAMELAQRFKAAGNYTKAEYTLSNAIRDGGSPELYIALCQTYLEQDKMLDAVAMLDNISDPQIRAALDPVRPAAPVTDKEPGLYSQYIDVTVTAPSGKLYLTTDGEYPSILSEPVTEPITLPAGETTIYAVAVGDNGLVSPVSIFGYTVGGVIEKVQFADSAVEQEVRRLLGVNPDTALYTNDLWKVTELTLPEDTKTCDDVARMPYLRTLVLPEGLTAGAEVLTGLQYLENLSISGSPVSGEDLQTIAALPNLTNLTLKNCSLSNIEALSGAQKLTSLDLSSNAIRNLEPLSHLMPLEQLNLSHNALTNLTALGGLGNLKWLDVSYNALTSMAPICACVKLEYLDVSHNNLVTLSAADSLTRLVTLLAENNKLAEAAVLGQCSALEELDLSNNALTDITALSPLEKLRVLNFSHNQVAELPAFSQDCALSTVDGSYNLLTTLEPLGGLSYLNKVLMDYNEQVSSVDALVDCPRLVQVSVYGTVVIDVSMLTERSVVVNYDPTQALALQETEPEE